MTACDGKVPSVAVKLKGSVVMTVIKKTYRINKEIDEKIKDMIKVYGAKSENELFENIIKDIYELKKSKAIVPIEELDRRDEELKKLYFELGRLKNELEQKENELEKEQKKGFWARLFRG